MAKLPNGVTQRKDGLYVGRFQYQGIRYNVTDQDMKKCADKLEKMKYEIKNGIYCKESVVTVNSWFRTWIDEYKKPTVKENTIDTYEIIYKKHIKKPLGSRKIKEIRPEMIQRLYNSMKKQKLFMEYAKDSEIADICELFLSTGLRSGELRGLDWETDIDFKNKVIHVTGTLCHSGETGWRKDEPKTRTSKRDIPMLGNVERLLKRVRRQQMEKKLYMGDKWQPVKGFENLVFLEESGLPMYQSSLKTKVDKIQRAIIKDGHVFEWITPHTFRHTFATRCIENGIPPQVLKGILGHSTLSMTMDLYAHVLPDTKAKELQKIANLF